MVNEPPLTKYEARTISPLSLCELTLNDEEYRIAMKGGQRCKIILDICRKDT